MKTKILFLSLLIICAGFQSCHDGMESQELSEFMYISIMGANDSPSVKQLNPASADTVFNISVAYGGTTNYNQGDIQVSIAADFSLVNTYNTANSTNYLPMPESVYSFDNLSILIANGTNRSKAVKLNVKPLGLDLSYDYILPVTVTSVSGGDIPLNEELKTIYLIFQCQADEALDKDQWTSAGASSIEQPEYGVENVFDDDLGNYWHSGVSGALPQWFAVNMNGYKRFNGFAFTNAPDLNPDALPKHVVIAISVNGINWTDVLDIPAMEQSDAMQVLPLSHPALARYFKVTVLSTWNNAPYTYVGDVFCYAGDTPEEPPQVIDKSKWTIIEDPCAWNANYGAERTIDGNPRTDWHTNPVNGLEAQWYFIVQFNKSFKINGILFQHSADAARLALPKHILFQASTDGVNWTNILEIENMNTTRNEQRLDCTTVMRARYLKVRILSNQNGQNRTYIGELSIY
ncbi:MAG: discoidin domain-containing protein [Tannerella sp.]|jgi:hypothetical protein|nr:discoidin domain-containing protein [Tannerella sp.]